jgi:hypothetical protein
MKNDPVASFSGPILRPAKGSVGSSIRRSLNSVLGSWEGEGRGPCLV